MVEQVTKYTGGENSQAIKNFANDITDVLVDVKIDLEKFNPPTERTDDGKSKQFIEVGKVYLVKEATVL